jgi:hypothetical protein
VSKKRLPNSEIGLLRALKGPALHARATALHNAGWPLAAIGEALDPPRTRSTVRAWVTRPTTHSPQTHIFPLPPLSSFSSSSSSSSSTILRTAEKESFSSPSSSTSSAAASSAAPDRNARNARKIATRFDPSAPELSSAARERIAEISPIARRYRAGTNPDGPHARANAELTMICRSEAERGVSVRELADAADVTYSAMRRRLSRT